MNRDECNIQTRYEVDKNQGMVLGRVVPDERVSNVCANSRSEAIKFRTRN
jgi:hypothetical protein